MKIACTSLGCSAEKPVDYCKECSHANWIVSKDLTFNPMFGFSSEKDIDWDEADKWLEKYREIDINKTSFKLDN